MINAKRLWVFFSAAFAVALAGATVLLVPALEYFVADMLTKLHLPVGLLANLALYAEFALLSVSVPGLAVMSVHGLSQRVGRR